MLKHTWQRISDKTFLSFVGSYLIGCWAIIQFVDWIANRYGYAASWTDLLLRFMLLLLPGILLIAWRKTGDRTKNKSGVGILSVNLLLATAISFFGFSSEVSAKTEKVTLTNEEGKEVVRTIPNQSLTKRIVIFPYQGEDLEKWQALGWSMLQSLDIEQDNRISTFNGFYSYFKYLVEDYNYTLFDAIPFSIQRKIAQDNLSDYWITCTISDSLRYKAYSSNDGIEFLSKSYPKGDIYTPMDQFTEALESALFNKEIFGQQKKMVDLPASQLLNAREEAIELYLKARIVSSLENDHTKALDLLKSALKIDPNFALAHAHYGLEEYYNGNASATIPALEKAISMMAALPERLQFNIKAGYYGFNNDSEKQIRLLEMWRKLYPHDANPYEQLFGQYRSIGNYEEASRVGEQALAAGHQGSMLLKLARLHLSLTNLDKAEFYLNSYQATYPDKAADTKEFGILYAKKGQLDKAINFYEELTVLNPSDHMAYLYLAGAQTENAEFSKGEKSIETALRVSNNIQDTIGTYEELESILAEQGKMNAAIEVMEKRRAILRTIYPESSVGRELMQGYIINRYASIGRQEEVRKMALSWAQKVETDQMDISCLALTNYFLAIEDGVGIKKQLEQCGDDITTSSGHLIYGYVEGQRDMYLGNVKAAIPKLEMFIDSSGIGTSQTGELILAECYRLDTQLEKSQKLYEQALKIDPNDAEILYDYALCLKAADKKELAKKAVEQALFIWKDADENYAPAIEANVLLAGLEEL